MLEAWTISIATTTFIAFILLLTEMLEAARNKVCSLLSDVCLFALPLWPISGVD